MRRLILIVVATSFLTIILLSRNATAQTPVPIGSKWSTPKRLFEDLGGFMRLDYMLADPTGTTHVFWSYNPRSAYDAGYQQSQTVIYYQSLQQDHWGKAQDILLDSSARMPLGAVIDARGTLHILTNVGAPACLSYISVSAQIAGDLRAWSGPKCLQGIGVSQPDLAIDKGGILYTLFIRPDQRTITLMQSLDAGLHWLSAVDMAGASTRDVFVTNPRLVVDTKGRIHATWVEVQAPTGYPPRSIMYSRSTDGGKTWSLPFQLAADLQTDQNLVVFGDSVHIVWNGASGYHGRYYRFSSDGGLNWSPRETLPLPKATGGSQGAPAITIDSLGSVHILYTDSPTLYYINRRGASWSQPELIASSTNTGATREINYPMLAITEGNKLHALYTRDANAVYYQERTIDAPSEQVYPYPTPAALMPTATSAPTIAPAATRKPQSTPSIPVSTAPAQGEVSDSSVGFSMIMAVLPALVVILGVVIVRLMQSRRL